MPYTITTEAGRAFEYPSEEAYLGAERWYNASYLEKEEFIDFCRKRGVEIVTPDGCLVDDWADIAMHTFATKR